MEYQLMNKDTVVATFRILSKDTGNHIEMISCDAEKLPIGFTDMSKWLSHRNASKHNEHLRRLMADLGCNRIEGFIKMTHAASLNDTFWVKQENEDKNWKDVSFYTNNFDQIISKLAFEGIGLVGEEFSSTSPELSTEGSFRKCWRREDGEIHLYKRGRDHVTPVGSEVYCEVMASELASILCKKSIQYQMELLHGVPASKCKLFTNEKYGYIPAAKLLRSETDYFDLLAWFDQKGEADSFRRMVVLDAITFNVDRHKGNYGFLFDNDTLELKEMAPIFDFNLALFPYATSEDFKNIGKYAMGFEPRIGTDFTRIGQIALSEDIRADLKNLWGFDFSFQGDDVFPAWRVKAIEEMVSRQIGAVLNESTLHTKDVFVPSVYTSSINSVFWRAIFPIFIVMIP